jgi:predicted MFS family arabinose efflux permease
MKQRLALLTGVFVVMALSNAIVPVLPALAEGPALQGALFSAYFLGAFLTVLPAGVLSDRVGRVPLIQAGLALTLASGAAILAFPDPLVLLAARGIEGVGAGLFVPAAMSWINLQPDHEHMSGNFIAALNVGLVSGLLGTGFLSDAAGTMAGVAVFTAATGAPLLLSVLIVDATAPGGRNGGLIGIGKSYFWLYISTIVLVGATGVVTAVYPDFTGETPATLSLQLGMMNVATVFASFAASRAHLAPIPTIRAAALVMAAAVALSYLTPLAFVLIGGVAGVVMIAQINYLAADLARQGAVMGLFNAANYGGMTLLPFMAGVVAESIGFMAAFTVTAVLSAVMAVTIGRCRCPVSQ